MKFGPPLRREAFRGQSWVQLCQLPKAVKIVNCVAEIRLQSLRTIRVPDDLSMLNREPPQHSEHSHSWNELCNIVQLCHLLVYSSILQSCCNRLQLGTVRQQQSTHELTPSVTFLCIRFLRHRLHTCCLHATCATDPSSEKTTCVSQRVQRSPARDKDFDPSTAEEKCLHGTGLAL